MQTSKPCQSRLGKLSRMMACSPLASEAGVRVPGVAPRNAVGLLYVDSPVVALK